MRPTSTGMTQFPAYFEEHCISRVPMDTLLCKRCADIGLETLPYGFYSTVAEGIESAQKGCPGCVFILNAINQPIAEFSNGESIRQTPGAQIHVVPSRRMKNYAWLVVCQGPVTQTVETIRIIPLQLRRPGGDLLQGDEEDVEGLLGRPVARHSRDAIPLAKMWLERCRKQHGGLCQPQDKSPLPTRLVYIPRRPERRLRLCVTEGQKGQYCALSYVWGRGNTFTTTPSTLRDRMKGFDQTQLPSLLGDAVAIARQMGYSWIWIDALCVIQGDSEDWARQSARMAAVYGNAAFTIAADLAPDSSSRILTPRDVPPRFDFGTGTKSLVLFLERCWDQMQYMPLFKRGWAYQERILSTRVLHFLDNQVAWECNTTLYRESFHGHEPDTVRPLEYTTQHFAKHQVSRLFHDKTVASKGPSLDVRVGLWNYMVQGIAMRQFTVKSDRLPGVSGLASALEVPGMGKYLAGLWEYNPFISMAWYPIYAQTRSPYCYQGPSWSWVWTELQLIFHWGTWVSDSPAEVMHVWKLWIETYGPRLQGHDVRPSTSNPKGPVREGSYLIISGVCREIFILEDSIVSRFRKAGFTHDQNGRTALPLGARVHMDYYSNRSYEMMEYIASLHKDFRDVPLPTARDIEDAKRYLCVQIARERKVVQHNPKVLCLVLEKVDNEEGAFKRAGVYYFDADGSEEDAAWERRDLKLY